MTANTLTEIISILFIPTNALYAGINNIES
jgi:hypothetical protein